MAISKGTQVRQVVSVITGVVTAKRFNDDTDQFEFCVAYTEDDGHQAERWFSEAQIEESKPQSSGAKA